MKIEATINNKAKVEIQPDSKKSLTGKIGGEPYSISVFNADKNEIELSFKDKKRIGRLLQFDLEKKEVVIKIDGERLNVQLFDEYDLLLKSMGMDASAAKKVNELKAPMPGVVLDVLVSIGESVEVEAPLVVLEAMKMENVLASPTAGIVKDITVEKGNTVEKNKILIHFE